MIYVPNFSQSLSKVNFFATFSIRRAKIPPISGVAPLNSFWMNSIFVLVRLLHLLGLNLLLRLASCVVVVVTGGDTPLLTSIFLSLVPPTSQLLCLFHFWLLMYTNRLLGTRTCLIPQMSILVICFFIFASSSSSLVNLSVIIAFT